MSYILEDLEKAINKLEEVLEKEKTPIHRDSDIKRFELSFDLAWKAIKNFAKKEGLECYSPRSCFKAGFQLKVIDEPEPWMLKKHTNTLKYLFSKLKRLEV